MQGVSNACLPLLEFAPDAIVITGRDGRIALVNRQTEVLFGYSRGEMLGQAVEMLLPVRFRASHVGQRGDYLNCPRTRPMGEGLDLAGRRKDGTEFPLEISLSPLEIEGSLLVTAFIRDVTERKRQEQEQYAREMLRADQLVALGQVAAGIAHELRNPLTSIKGLVQVNLKEADARGLPADDLCIIELEVRRMERTLQTFLDFARPTLPHRRQLDLASIAERVLALVAGRAEKQQVAVRFRRPEILTTVEADHDQIQQLLLNLVLNALDAMPLGGTLEVGISPPTADHIELRVLDTGSGIAPDSLSSIFEPFVSSKEMGVGLGLAVSRQIAHSHGGRLTAMNRPEGGASFSLSLPTSAQHQGR